MFSLDPSVVGLVPPCTCWRKDTITRLCTLHTCVTRSAKILSQLQPHDTSPTQHKHTDIYKLAHRHTHKYKCDHRQAVWTRGGKSKHVVQQENENTKSRCTPLVSDCIISANFPSATQISANFSTVTHKHKPFLHFSPTHTLTLSHTPTLICFHTTTCAHRHESPQQEWRE